MATKPTSASPILNSISVEERSRLAELIRYCSVSRTVRQEQAGRWRDWYERGCSAGPAAVYNKLYSHLNRLASFLFSPGTVRFGVHLPPSVREMWVEPSMIARDEFRNVWEAEQCDLIVLLALEWSLVYGTTILKIQPTPDGAFRLGYVQPWDFGVSREDVNGTDDQDTFCHWYSLSIPQIERWVGNHPQADALIALAKQHARPAYASRSRSRLVLSQISGTFPSGTISGGFPSGVDQEVRTEPMVEEPTVEFVDIWERRLFRRKGVIKQKKTEMFEDWLVTTEIADALEPLAQRRNPDLPWTRPDLTQSIPGELPFVVMSSRPVPDSFWGRSEMENLTALQDWLSTHVSDLREVIKKQLNPPKFFSGIPDAEEAGRALSTEGGSYSSPEPGARMEAIIPQLTQESVGMLSQIVEMFADESGIPSSLAEPAMMPGGIRSTGHFGMAAGIGAGRMRQMALIIEGILGDAATKCFHIMQRNSTELFRTDDGKPFILSQIPYQVTMTVNAHSAAPIFQEQTEAKAMMLQQAGAIGPEDLVELMDPPNREELKIKAKKISQGRAEAQSEIMDIQRTKAERSGKGPAMPKV